MALDQSALLEVLEALKAADVTCTDTRTDTRTGLRNGHRLRTLTTAAGGPERRIPKVRAGSFFPSLLERRRRVDQALFAVVMVLLHRLAPVLRGWVNYFRHGRPRPPSTTCATTRGGG